MVLETNGSIASRMLDLICLIILGNEGFYCSSAKKQEDKYLKKSLM